MKKKDLLSLSLLGLSAGLGVAVGVTGCQQHDKRPNTEAAEQMNPDVQSFYSSLTPEAQKKFNELDPQHQMMSMEMTKQQCNGKNQCKGLGGCRTKNHECAGLASCKGQGGPPLKDPSKAVDAQYNALHKARR